MASRNQYRSGGSEIPVLIAGQRRLDNDPRHREGLKTDTSPTPTPPAVAVATLGRAAGHQKKRALSAMRQRLAEVSKNTVVDAVGMVAANND